MRTSLLFALLFCTTASAAPRRLTLAEAVSAALRVEPLVTEAQLQERRAGVGVLRAQLDRFSLRIDGQLQELWNKSIGGTPLINCNTGGPAWPTDPATCAAYGGMVTGPAPDSQWQGLSNLQARLDYFVFSGFRVEANVTRAKLQEKSTLAQLKTQRKDTALQVARAYWNARRLTILRDVQAASLQRLVEAEAVADARVKAGLAAPIDRNRATQRRLAQTATLEDLSGQARVAAAQLGVLLDIAGELDLVENPEIPATVPGSPEELVCEAFTRRPEIQNAKLQTAAQRESVRMARSTFYPQLSVFGLFQYGNNVLNVASGTKSSQAANPFGGLTGNFTGGASLTVNFFDTLNTYTATADATYLAKVLDQETRRYRRLVDSDVRTTYGNLTKLYARWAPLKTGRDVAADNLKIIAGRYKNGDALVIEYLDAQIDLSTAELNLADVTAQLQEQWLELQASLGLIVGVDRG